MVTEERRAQDEKLEIEGMHRKGRVTADRGMSYSLVAQRENVLPSPTCWYEQLFSVFFFLLF